MKQYLLITALCLSAAVCFAQPPRGARHHEPVRHDQPRHNHIECATPEQMHMVMHVLKDLSFDDKKSDVAKLCVTLGHFCTSDLAQIAAMFSFDDKRLEFLQYAYPYCTDPFNYPYLRECFSFESNYDKLMESIRPPHPRR